MGSSFHLKDIKTGPPLPHAEDIRAYSKEYADLRDRNDPLRHFRDEFLIPSKEDLKRKTLAIDHGIASDATASESKSIYLCGNSLGVQPRNVLPYVDAYLRTWAIKGVMGHFVSHEDQLLPPFVDVDRAGAKLMAPIVGAQESEVAVMGTLTANLHLLMASFYRPTKDKYKIILEGKAFPSDHFAIESQIQYHGLDPREAMILIEPQDADMPYLDTESILRTIDEHADQTALVLLPAIQYYTGQYFDMRRITEHAHSKGIIIGWDCAHAAGNVDLKLHEWDVDFAAWCTYKYLNSGPGAMAGIFIHERHGNVDMKRADAGTEAFRPRLAGWWGSDKETRFRMENTFVPQPGAAGFQLSNPSVLDMTAVIASLEVFNRTSMSEIRNKSIELTSYLEHLLLKYPLDTSPASKPYRIITPSDPAQRGAQLSLLLEPGLLDSVKGDLEAQGVVVDERRPNVIRVAPAPLYNSFADVLEFCHIFHGACERAVASRD